MGDNQFNKLGALLESKNSAIREEAIQVFAKLPFTDSTLSIVRSHLTSNAWHSRVAAADAFGLLLQNCFADQPVPVWKWEESGGELAKLSVDTLLQTYHPLLSTEGATLDSKGIQLSVKEQRAQLNQLLEFDQAGISSNFIQDSEILVNHTDGEFKGKQLGVEEDIVTSDLVTKILIESLTNMVDHKWELRHGGVLALEKILIHYFDRLGPVLVEKITIRLVQLLTLDRFFDFVSGGSSVAPVRETAAKCVSLLIVKTPQGLQIADQLVENIRKLLDCSEEYWYCRQSALLVLKYFFALSNHSERFLDFFQSTLKVLSGGTDEVLSSAIVALSALLANNQIDIGQRATLIGEVIAKIWNMLENAELRAHMKQGVDSLLVDILKIVDLWMKSNDDLKLDEEKFILLLDLVDPRFMSRATLALNSISLALQRGIALGAEQLVQFLGILLRTLLLCGPTDSDELIRSIFIALDSVLIFYDPAFIEGDYLSDSFGKWMSCLVADLRNPIINLSDYPNPSDESATAIMCGEDVRASEESAREEHFVNRKLCAARFLSPILDALYKSDKQVNGQKVSDSIQLILKPWLHSGFASFRFGAALILNCWARVFRRSYNKDPERYTQLYPMYTIGLVHQWLTTPPPMNEEMQAMVANLTIDLNAFRRYCAGGGVTWEEMNADQSNNLLELAKNAYDKCRMKIRNESEIEPLKRKYEAFTKKVDDLQVTNAHWNNRINSLYSSCLLYFSHMPTQITPMIKPLMEAAVNEKNDFLRKETLHDAFTLLISATEKRDPCPHIKIIKQLTMGLISCDVRSPKIEQWSDETVDESILSVRSESDIGQRSLNCEFVLQVLSSEYRSNLLTICTPFAELIKWSDVEELQEQMLRLDILRITSQFIQHTRTETEVDAIAELMGHSNPAVRHYVARYFSTVAAINLADSLNDFYDGVKNNLGRLDDKSKRLGAIEVVYRLAQFENGLLGAIPLFAPLTFAAMSDGVESIRDAAAVAFRKMVAIMPLEQGGNLITEALNKDLKKVYHDNLNFLNVLSCPARLPVIGKEEIPGLDQSVDIRHYQLEGITWMRFLYSFGLNGVLADDMGLGKTLQTLCLIALWMKNRKDDELSLIVCPKTLINHWCKEWKRYFPEMPAFTSSLAALRTKKGKTANKVSPVVVTSYDEVRNDAYTGFSTRNYEFVILDEGHCIRNHTGQLFKVVTSLTCRHRLILSGTPVQNSPADLWSLFRFIMPGYLSSRSTFFSSFMKPIMACRNPKATDKQTKEGMEALKLLHKQVLPFVMRRLKSEVLQELPEKVIQDYPCYLSEQQKALYQAISECCVVRGGGGGLSALTTLTALRKAVDHPRLVSHDLLAKVHFNPEGLNMSLEMSGKMVALRQLLNECNIGASADGNDDSNDVEQVSIPLVDRHRALIFCQWRDTVDMIANYIDSLKFGPNISYLRLDGTVPAHERQDVADRFNTDASYDLLLLTTHVGGVGLTLTGANVVIFVDHDWNPVKDLQAIDRAHRLGQKRTVHVYRLITQGTIEEKVMNYQKFKTDTANALIGAENKSLSSMATDGLMDLLTFSDDKAVTTSAETTDEVPKKRAKLATLGVPETLDEKKWNLEELWDESQYDELHSVTKFVRNVQ